MLAWVEATLGVKICGMRAFKGGSSSSIHSLRVEGKNCPQTVVLRRYVLEELNAEEPDIAEREARVLQLLERVDVPTPGLLAVDPTGRHAGVPTIVMTRVGGRLDWAPTDLDGWLHQLAWVLPEIHAASINAADGVREFTPYVPESWEPPGWLTNKLLWERAVEVFHGPRLDPDRVFIHRDYHPGNVLWRRGRVTGVVDWQAASIGPRAADVWHCRANLIGRFGIDVADRFLHLWQAHTGDPYHPWAETVMLVDALGWAAPRTHQEGADLEQLLARRLAEIGG